MFKAPKILVCTDFSDSADKALKFTRQYAHKTKGQVHLLHVADLSAYLNLIGTMPDINESILEVIQDDLIKRLHESARRNNLNADVKVIIDSNVSDGILKDIEEFKPDLVVLGGKGKSKLEKLFLGSVARKIAMTSPAPVMIIKEEKELKKVCALVDSHEEMKMLLENAFQFKALYDSEVLSLSLVPQSPGLYHVNNLEYSSVVAHAVKNASEVQIIRNKEKLKELLNGRNAEIIVKASFEKDLGVHLTEIMEDEKVDLAILKRHHRPVFERMILGSVASRVIETFDGNLLLC